MYVNMLLYLMGKIEPTSFKKSVLCMRGSFPLALITVTGKFALFIAWKVTHLILKKKERIGKGWVVSNDCGIICQEM